MITRKRKLDKVKHRQKQRRISVKDFCTGLCDIGDTVFNLLFCTDEINKVLGKTHKEGMKLALINFKDYDIKLSKRASTIVVSSVRKNIHGEKYGHIRRRGSGYTKNRRVRVDQIEYFLGERIKKGMVLALVDLADYDVEGF